MDHVRTLDAQLPKLKADGTAWLSRKPDISKDLAVYQGRQYILATVQGDDADSSVWILSATAPL